MSRTGEAYFEIAGVFEITGRGVVLAGQIRSGVLRAGLQVHLPLNRGLTITSTVTSIEFVDRAGGVADVGLILAEESPEGRSPWKQACGVGEVIRLSDADGNGRAPCWPDSP